MSNMRLILIALMFSLVACRETPTPRIRDAASFAAEASKPWPNNSTINIVFHGHSVPAGFAVTPVVRTTDAYPYQLLDGLKNAYPFAQINVIVTARGGESAAQGSERLEEALSHDPDVLVIDYGLNDVPGTVYAPMQSMASRAKARGVRTLLLTPSPDLVEGERLALIRDEVLSAGIDAGVAVVQPRFPTAPSKLMAQRNHPNRMGHAIIAQALLPHFLPNRLDGQGVPVR